MAHQAHRAPSHVAPWLRQGALAGPTVARARRGLALSSGGRSRRPRARRRALPAWLGLGACGRGTRRRALETQIEDRVAQNYVASEAQAYLASVALLAAPLVVRSDAAAPALLLAVASLTVYLGSCAPALLPRPSLTPAVALVAPFLAAVPLLGLYAGQAMRWDVALPYKDFVCIFGWLGLENVITNGLAGLRSLPLRASVETRTVSAVAALVVVFVCLSSSGPLEVVASNAIAWSLALLSIRAATVQSFSVAALLLLAFLCYDVIFVFGSDMMATVASQVEAPFAIRMAKSLSSEHSWVSLGLGDIVIPGVAVAFLRRFEETSEGSYFLNAMLAYVLGLVMAVVVNTFIANGQPALLYIVPSILASTLLTAAWHGEMQALLSPHEEEEERTVVGDDVPGLSASRLLVARDGRDDGMFGGSVLLLLEHDHSRGSLGVVVNRPLSEPDRERLSGWLRESVLLRDRMEESALRLLAGDVRVGGPVRLGDFPSKVSVVLHGHRDRSPRTAGASKGGGAPRWSYLRDWDPARDPRGAILLVGLAAWLPGQLAEEVRRGTWGLAAAAAADVCRPGDLRGHLMDAGRVEWLTPGGECTVRRGDARP